MKICDLMKDVEVTGVGTQWCREDAEVAGVGMQQCRCWDAAVS